MYKIVHELKCGGMMGSCKPNHYYSGENWKTVSRPDQVRPLSLYQANRPQFYLKIFNETEGEDRRAVPRGADVNTFHWHHLDILTTPPSYQTVKTWRLSASSTWLSRHTWSKRSGATSEMWLCDMWAGGERASCERESVEGWSWTLDTIWWDSVLSCSSSRHNDNMRPAPHHDTPPHSSSHAQGGRHGLRRPGHGAARQVGHGGGHLRLQQHEYQPSGKYIRLYWKYFLMDYTSSALIKFLMDHSITEESE